MAKKANSASAKKTQNQQPVLLIFRSPIYSYILVGHFFVSRFIVAGLPVTNTIGGYQCVVKARLLLLLEWHTFNQSRMFILNMMKEQTTRLLCRQSNNENLIHDRDNAGIDRTRVKISLLFSRLIFS